jgi:hypothetical protein
MVIDFELFRPKLGAVLARRDPGLLFADLTDLPLACFLQTRAVSK